VRSGQFANGQPAHWAATGLASAACSRGETGQRVSPGRRAPTPEGANPGAGEYASGKSITRGCGRPLTGASPYPDSSANFSSEILACHLFGANR
jgi:hypothetical protein